LQFVADDELVEVTPKSIRLRKAELSALKRRQAAGRRIRGEENGKTGLA
jgi:GTP-binding protein